MTLEEAKKLLVHLVRKETYDRALEGHEVAWVKGDTLMADGFFGGDFAKVTVYPKGSSIGGVMKPEFEFKGNDAHELRQCGDEEERCLQCSDDPKWADNSECGPCADLREEEGRQMTEDARAHLRDEI